jgi:hypothetical protein
VPLGFGDEICPGPSNVRSWRCVGKALIDGIAGDLEKLKAENVGAAPGVGT